MESIPQVPIIAIPEIHTVEQPEDSTKKIISEENKAREQAGKLFGVWRKGYLGSEHLLFKCRSSRITGCTFHF
jgi:hypothetical protein